MSLTKVSNSMITGSFFNALDYGASPSATAAVNTSALQAAINAAIAAKQPLFIPGGTYLTNATLIINSPYNQGFTLFGAGVGTGSTCIKAVHTGNAVISMIGSIQCRISDLSLQGDSATYPKCGIILGRNSGASAGWHTFTNVQICGDYSVAGVYNIASEGNGWHDLFVIINTAKYGVYISGSDGESIGGLTASSMIGAQFYNASVYVQAGANVLASVFIVGAIATGNIGFFGGYFVTCRTSYVTITTSFQDGQDSCGPYIFDGVSGETVGNPSVVGFKCITNTGGVFLRNLYINKCSFLCGTVGRFLTQDALTGFRNCFIQGGGIQAAGDYVNISLSDLNTYGDQSYQNFSSYIDVGYGFYRSSAYTPVIAAGSGTITAYTATGYYVRIGQQVTVYVTTTITNKGTAANYLTFTLPFPALTTQINYAGTVVNTTLGWSGPVLLAPTQNYFVKYDGTSGIDNNTYNLSVTYVTYYG